MRLESSEKDLLNRFEESGACEDIVELIKNDKLRNFLDALDSRSVKGDCRIIGSKIAEVILTRCFCDKGVSFSYYYDKKTKRMYRTHGASFEWGYWNKFGGINAGLQFTGPSSIEELNNSGSVKWECTNMALLSVAYMTMVCSGKSDEYFKVFTDLDALYERFCGLECDYHSQYGFSLEEAVMMMDRYYDDLEEEEEQDIESTCKNLLRVSYLIYAYRNEITLTSAQEAMINESWRELHGGNEAPIDAYTYVVDEIESVCGGERLLTPAFKKAGWLEAILRVIFLMENAYECNTPMIYAYSMNEVAEYKKLQSTYQLKNSTTEMLDELIGLIDSSVKVFVKRRDGSVVAEGDDDSFALGLVEKTQVCTGDEFGYIFFVSAEVDNGFGVDENGREVELYYEPGLEVSQVFLFVKMGFLSLFKKYKELISDIELKEEAGVSKIA